MIFSQGSAENEEKVLSTSSPTRWLDERHEDPIAVLKRNVSDTLTFLHQERNDFLPEDDIIIPSRKEDHISKEIDLNSINLKIPKKSTADYYEEDLREALGNEVEEVIKQAEDVVNQKLNDLDVSSNKTLKFSDEIVHIEGKQDFSEEKLDSLGEDVVTLTEDSMENLESLKDDSISVAQERSEEAFKFLDNEACSPLCTAQSISDFLVKESEGELAQGVDSEEAKPPKSPKSSIPVAKPRKSVDKEKDVDALFGEDKSKVNNELLTKIPVMKSAKVKTIKKHSKDPLKEFVTLSKDVNWDDDGDTTEIITTVTAEPIVKTTITKVLTTESTPESIKSKIPVLQTDVLPLNFSEEFPESDIVVVDPAKSKIPVFKSDNTKTTVTTETVTSPNSTKVIEMVETYITSPGSKVSTKSSTVDSDSDDDSRRSPPLRGILKKTTCMRTVGSSSGSDIALHEEGAELSEDESGMLYS